MAEGILIDSDQYGNRLYFRNKKKYQDVILYLKSRNEHRCLGKYYPEKRLFATKRDRDEHLHYKTGKYGFNDSFLRTLAPGTDVTLQEKGSAIKRMIKVEDLLSNGEYLHFLGQGFERQIFIKVDKPLFRLTV